MAVRQVPPISNLSVARVSFSRYGASLFMFPKDLSDLGVLLLEGPLNK